MSHKLLALVRGCASYSTKSYSGNSNDEFREGDFYKTIDDVNKRIIKADVKTSDYEST